MIDPEILKRQILLSDIDKEGLEKISKIIKRVSFKKGEQLFKEKDETKGLYLVNSGKVNISKLNFDGWRQTLAVFASGHFFGELSILEKRQHEAAAVAVEDTEVFLIAKADFDELMRKDITLACMLVKKIALMMSKNLRRMNNSFLSVLVGY